MIAPEQADASVTLSASTTMPWESTRLSLERLRSTGALVVHARAGDPPLQAAAAAVLSQAERREAERIPGRTARAQYRAGRVLLRSLLGSLLSMRPRALSIEAPPFGKPRLASPLGEARDLDFSIAHAGDHVVVGLTLHGGIGVDVEPVRDVPRPVARRVLRADEAMLLARLAPVDRACGLWTIWTLKEAWAKATGRGVAAVRSRRLDRGPAGERRGLHGVLTLPGPVVVAVVVRSVGGAIPRHIQMVDLRGSLAGEG